MRTILALFLIAIPLRAQVRFTYDPSAEEGFSRAVTLFRQGNYTGAIGLFDTLAGRQPMHQRTTASYLMAAKSRFRAGEYRESAGMLVNFLQKFPESSYGADGRFSLGLDYMMLQAYADAAGQLLRCLDLT